MSIVISALVAVAIAATGLTAGRGVFVRRPARDPSPNTVRSWGTRRRWRLPIARRSNDVLLPASVAAWADDLARSLRHGSTLHAALTHTLPTDVVVERRSASLRHWLSRGATVVDACDEWSAELADDALVRSNRRRSSDRCELLSTMAAVLAATAALGGAAAAPLDRFAITMRQRASDDLERAAHSAQAKMSAKVLTSVPLAVLAFLLLTDADVRAVIASTTGGSVVAVGLTLNTVGGFWMRRIASGRGEGAPC